MENTLWKNIKILCVSILLVISFIACFSFFYDKIRIKPSCEIKDYKVEVQVQKKDGSYVKLDSCHYKITPAPQITENPINTNDYSSFLVSFISVLATFVVIANFANAKDLLLSSDNAKKAKEEAEQAKNEAENAKGEAENAKSETQGVKAQVLAKIEEVNTILETITTLKDNVESVKSKADESLNNSSRLLEELNASIDSKFRDLDSQIKTAQSILDDTSKQLESKQEELQQLYDEAIRQNMQFEAELRAQKANINVTAQRLLNVENKVADIGNTMQFDNSLELQEQLDTDNLNHNLPVDIELNNN